jgi:WD40 repeat protein
MLNSKNVQHFSPDESYLVTAIGGHSRRMGVWDVSTGERVASFEHDQSLSDVVFHPLDQHLIVMTSYDQTVFCWNWKDDELVWRMRGSDSLINHLEMDLSGQRVYTGNKSGKVMVWEPEAERVEQMVDAHTFVPPLISPGSDLVMLSEWIPGPRHRAKDFSVSLLNSSAYPARQDKADDTNETSNILPGPNLSNGSEQEMRESYSGWKEAVFDPSSGTRLWGLDLFERGLGFSKDGSEFLTLTTNQVVFRKTQTGESVRTHRLHEPVRNRFFLWREPYRQMDLSSDRSLLAVNEDEAAARIISVDSGETVAVNDDLKTLTFIKFNPMRKQLLLQGSGILELWDYDRDALMELRTLARPWSVFSSAPAAYSPDGTMLAAACNDDSVRVWDAQTGELIQTIRGVSGGLAGVVFSPDGRTLVVKLSQPELMLWNTRTWRQLSALKSDHGLRFRNHYLFSPDGRFILADHFGKGAFLIQAPSFEEIGKAMAGEDEP